MKGWTLILTLLAGCVVGAAALAPRLSQGDAAVDVPAAAAARFEAVAVDVDPGGQPLAAYQFALSATNAQLRLVGLENGEHPAFDTPPYYDPLARAGDGGERIVVVDYTLANPATLPVGPTRLTTVMVEVVLNPGVDAAAAVDYQLELIAAGNPAGDRLDATIKRGP